MAENVGLAAFVVGALAICWAAWQLSPVTLLAAGFLLIVMGVGIIMPEKDRRHR